MAQDTPQLKTTEATTQVPVEAPAKEPTTDSGLSLAQSPMPTTTTTTTNTNTSTATPASVPTHPPPTTISTTSTAYTPISPQPLREDLIKSAVSFLSSPNIKSADHNKKVAFLKNKGLGDQEIQEAFQRVGDNVSNSTTAIQKPTLPPASMPSNGPLIPSRPQYPPQQVIYYPQPPPPSMPVERVLAVAILFGVGAVGLTASVLNAVKYFIQPIRNRIAAYQQTRYQQQTEMLSRMDKLLKDAFVPKEEESEKDKERETSLYLHTIVKNHQTLSDLGGKWVEETRLLVKEASTTSFEELHSSLKELRMTVSSSEEVFSAYPSYGSPYGALRNPESPSVQALKSEIRSFKGALLNRRNFPMVTPS
ncbi:peroxisomal membrane anchor protein conserved region-domain-containing protein [Spinellus fusiger]|nr:peroxisomal membrane anchor protein conserved region-domain-containing protein [Spinellus fusiger]